MASPGDRALNGTQNAALLLMTLGEDDAAEILKYMGTDDVQRIGTAMATLANVTRDHADHVLSSFITAVEDPANFAVGTEDYVRKVLSNAFGEGKATAFINKIMADGDARGLDALKWMSSTDVADIIEGEHPQIAAIVIAYLDNVQAAEVIGLLPEDRRADVIMRVARLSDIQQSALAEIEALIASKSTGTGGKGVEKVGGDKFAADIINALDAESGEALLEKVKEKDQELSERIRDKMIVFETLLAVDDRGIQALLREVSNDLLVVALKACDPAIKDKIFNNMSKRAATLMQEDMEARGPMRLSEVEESQRGILAILRKLVDAGDVSLGLGGEEYV
jgi:flagellar motor switch protein FliG